MRVSFEQLPARTLRRHPYFTRSMGSDLLEMDYAAERSLVFEILPARHANPDLKQRSLAEWITEIRMQWGRGASGALDLARLISQAKKHLQRGEWSRLWVLNDFPFSKRKGEMLALIGSELG